METDTVIRLTSQAMLLCLTLSLPAMLASAAIGLLVAFVQAITSMQEQAISQVAKLAAVTVVLVIFAPWGGALVLRFAQSVFGMALQ